MPPCNAVSMRQLRRKPVHAPGLRLCARVKKLHLQPGQVAGDLTESDMGMLARGVDHVPGQAGGAKLKYGSFPSARPSCNWLAESQNASAPGGRSYWVLLTSPGPLAPLSVKLEAA